MAFFKKRQHPEGVLRANEADEIRKEPAERLKDKQARLEAVTEQVNILRGKLPILLRRLRSIPDPRNPRKIKHQLTCLMIYGILIFVLQMSSRREENRELTRPKRSRMECCERLPLSYAYRASTERVGPQCCATRQDSQHLGRTRLHSFHPPDLEWTLVRR